MRRLANTRPWVLAALALLWRQSIFAQELPPDLVVLSGSDLPSLAATPVDEIAAFAEHDGALAPVHVQVDQRDAADGGWAFAFESGAEPRAARHAGLGPDDLVLLSLDEGGARLRPPLPQHVEIEVTRADGATRWFYVGRGVSRLAPLLRYDPSTDGVVGADYGLRFSRSGAPVLDALVIGDPAHDPNLLDRNKARLDVDVAFGIGTLHRSEDDVRLRTTGLHIGPLRIIRECEVRGRMLLGIYSPPLRDNFIFYPHGFMLPATVRLAPALRMLVHEMTLRISMDLAAGVPDLTFQSAPDILDPIPVDGHHGQRGTQQPIEWYLLRRGDVGLLGWLRAREDVAREVSLYYHDDLTHPDPPEQEVGERGDHGFLFRHTGPLPAGEIRLSSYGWVVHADLLRQPAAALRAFTSQTAVRVHPAAAAPPPTTVGR